MDTTPPSTIRHRIVQRWRLAKALLGHLSPEECACGAVATRWTLYNVRPRLIALEVLLTSLQPGQRRADTWNKCGLWINALDICPLSGAHLAASAS